MVDKRTLNCLHESEVDTIEISLRNRMEELISEGDLSTAEVVEATLEQLNHINVCDESAKWVRDLAEHGRIKDSYGR